LLKKSTGGSVVAAGSSGTSVQGTDENQTNSQAYTKGKQSPKLANGKPLARLKDLPPAFWKESPYDGSGTQFYTKVRIGLSSHNIMLDGGSGVNSTTEELILQIINENREAGISFADKRHPINQLEKWKHTEGLRGVAGAKTVPLLGAVVVRLNMVELGKDDGPEILARFKTRMSRSTDNNVFSANHILW